MDELRCSMLTMREPSGLRLPVLLLLGKKAAITSPLLLRIGGAVLGPAMLCVRRSVLRRAEEDEWTFEALCVSAVLASDGGEVGEAGRFTGILLIASLAGETGGGRKELIEMGAIGASSLGKLREREEAATGDEAVEDEAGFIASVLVEDCTAGRGSSSGGSGGSSAGQSSMVDDCCAKGEERTSFGDISADTGAEPRRGASAGTMMGDFGVGEVDDRAGVTRLAKASSRTGGGAASLGAGADGKRVDPDRGRTTTTTGLPGGVGY